MEIFYPYQAWRSWPGSSFCSGLPSGHRRVLRRRRRLHGHARAQRVRLSMAYAIGTDMAHIAGKSVVATAKHRKYGNVDMRLGLLMIVGPPSGSRRATTIMWLERVGRVDFVVRITYMVLLFASAAICSMSIIR